MDRREFITAAGGVGVTVALTGCSSVSNDPNEPTPVPAPSLPSDQLADGGWEKVDTETGTVFEGSFAGGLVDVSASQHTLVYEDTDLRRRVREGTLGNFDNPLRQFFASRIDLDPDLNSISLIQGSIVDRTEEKALEQFRERLTKTGIEAIDETGTDTLEIHSGDTARLTELSGTFPFDSQSVPIANGDELTIEGGDVKVTGILAVWAGEEDVFAAGGAFPGENFYREITKEITEMIDTIVVIDLGLDPAEYRSELFNLIRRVH